MGTIRILSGSQIREAVQMTDIIEAVRNAFVELSAGGAVMPIRSHISIAEPRGDALFMPSYMNSTERIGVKTVTLFEDNRTAGLPYIQALVSVYDGRNGTPQAVLDGTTITALRTGAASGLATELLSRPESKTCGIIGAGVQGITQLEAVCAVRPIDTVLVYDPHPETARTFAEAMGKTCAVEVEVLPTVQQVVRSADIICCATISETPVFDDHDLNEGVHINGVGSYQPHVQEIPEETVRRSRLFVDHRESALAETGDLIIPLAKGVISENHILGEIGAVAAGEVMGRISADDITFFKSVGVAVQDLAAASVIIERAEERNIGSVVDFSETMG